MKLRVALAISSILILGGCSTVTTDRLDNFSATDEASGFTYFLPTRLIKFTATREPASSKELGQKKTQLEAALATASQSFSQADTAFSQAKGRHDAAIATSASADTLSALRQALELASANRFLAEKAKIAAQASVNEISTQISTTVRNQGCQYTAKIELLPAQADPRYRMVSRMSHSALRDDLQTFAVSSAGLLTSASIIATDRTGDILTEAARSVGRLSSFNPAMLVEGEKVTGDCGSKPSVFVQIIDPMFGVKRDGGNVAYPKIEELNLALRGAEFPFQLVPDADYLLLNNNGFRFDSANDWDPVGGEIFYRTPVPVTFTIKQNATPIASVVANLPQAGPITSLPMKSSAFVKSQDTLVFVDGMLTSWTNDRPSEFAGAVSVPGQILGGLVGGVVQGFTDSASLNDKETISLESGLAIEKARLERDAILLCIRQAQAKASADALACFPDVD